jgi:hypothetical protein
LPLQRVESALSRTDRIGPRAELGELVEIEILGGPSAACGNDSQRTLPSIVSTPPDLDVLVPGPKKVDIVLV